jgi:hypothetical protein
MVEAGEFKVKENIREEYVTNGKAREIFGCFWAKTKEKIQNYKRHLRKNN